MDSLGFIYPFLLSVLSNFFVPQDPKREAGRKAGLEWPCTEAQPGGLGSMVLGLCPAGLPHPPA